MLYLLNIYQFINMWGNFLMEDREVVLINKFDGEYDFLSNFYPSPIKIEGIEFPTVEHAFQAMKSLDITERQMIANEPTPGRAKRAGRKVALRDNWEKVKCWVMRECLRKKFSTPELKEKLLSTGNAYLIEGNEWHDQFWGSCYCPDCLRRPGLNMLGQLLMDIREEIRK